MSAWIVIEKVKICNVTNQVDLRHMCEVEGSNVVDLGIDLSEFYMSVEWDILEVPAVRWAQFSIKILFQNHFDVMSSHLQEWKILYMLWWALSGHNVQHNNATEDVVLYGAFKSRFLRGLQTD